MSARELLFLHYLTAVFDHIDEAVLLIGVEPEGYRALFTNDQLMRMLGYTPADTGKLIKDIVPPQRFKLLVRHYDEAVTSKEPHKFTYSTRTTYGMRTLRATLVPVLNTYGTCTHIVSLIRNVTRAKQEKYAFRSTLEALTAVEASLEKYLLVMNEDATVQYVSPWLKPFAAAPGLEQLEARLPAKLSDLLPDAAESLMTLIHTPAKQVRLNLQDGQGTMAFTAKVTRSHADTYTIELAV
jgi:PAS domain S-box-containing protein